MDRAYVSPVPFGLGSVKPQHYRAMLKVLWDNRDALPHAWKVLTQGTCDGCALGTIGLHDWTLREDAVHLCTVRLELLRLNTIGAIQSFEEKLADVSSLAKLDSKALRALGRIPYPMRRRAGEKGFRRISWDEAFAELGAKIRSLSNPNRFAIYCTSRGLTNETYYLAQKAARFIGTNNVENSARLCHSPSTAALKDTVGVGATTCSYRDLYAADLIVFIGSNPANDQPVSMKYLHEAKQRGTKVVTINTYKEPGMERYWVPSNIDSALFGTVVSDAFFMVHTGGDLAFLNAVQKVLIERGWIDRTFLRDHVIGYEGLVEELARQNLYTLCQLAGVTLEDVERFARLLAEAKSGILVWSMGVTQHAHGSDTVRAIANLGLLRGWLGKEGSGLMPIRGHSGVQGGAEMGAYSTAFPGGKPITQESAAELSSIYGFSVPAEPGLRTTAMLDAAREGELDVFHIAGGNFLETLPDPTWVKDALGLVGVRVHQDIILTTMMLIPPKEAVYLLPARTRYEQAGGGTETTTERRVILSPEIPGHQIGEAMSEWEIFMRLAEAVHPDRSSLIHFEDALAIRREIGRVVPGYGPIADLREGGDQFQWGGPRLCEGGVFPLPGGKARLRPVVPPELTLKPDELRLSTRRGKQFNSMVQAEVDPLNGAHREDVLMSPVDAQRIGVQDQDWVVLVSAYGNFRGRVRLAPIRPGNVQGHWPEVNVLLPRGRIDRDGGVPDYNAVVRVLPAYAGVNANDSLDRRL
jgi:molybdopterin-dependent oxidoreductase alpha subunit